MSQTSKHILVLGEVPQFDEENKPYNVHSYIYIGILGGILPLMVLALENLRRLQTPIEIEKKSYNVGVLFIILWIGISWLIFNYLPDVSPRNTYKMARRSGQILGGLYAMYLLNLHKKYFNVFSIFHGGEPLSLWKYGFYCVMVIGTIQNIIHKILTKMM